MNFKLSKSLRLVWPLAVTVLVGGTGIANGEPASGKPQASGTFSSAQQQLITAALKKNVQNIVVIYAENRSFDNMYGTYPGANGIPGVNATSKGAYLPQRDRDANKSLLQLLPQTWGGVTASGQTPVVTQAQSDGLPNAPFSIEGHYGINQAEVTRDLYHRFYENQMQIDGGKNDEFAGYADAGGLTMGYYDGSQMAMWKIAQQYTLADNFFQGAFGGSFLNHQYLICACEPEYPNADTAAAKPAIAVLNTDANGNYLPQLTLASTSPASALEGPPSYVLSGTITPKNYFGDGTFRAINTMQAPYQPSGNAPVDANGTDLLYANTAKSTTLPPQTQTNIGDQLNTAGINWAWFAGSWNAAVADGTQSPSVTRTVIYAPSTAGAAPDFQPHHQPFNYYANLDPVADVDARAAHLKDYTDLVSQAAAGTLPPVAFYKPEGDLNQHSGYASVEAGDAHIAGLIAALQASPQWKNMVIVVTYDENGGFWDHVAPPKGDLAGPGTRIPALIISPFSKKGYVDHTQYDTASVLRLIERRFGLPTLAGLTARDTALVANGKPAMGDLTDALQFRQ